LFFHLPDGMKCTAASVAYVPAEPKLIAPNVLALAIPAVRDEPVSLELRFAGEVGKAATRPFADGLVGEVKTQP
jgi:hypothetical protein